MVLCPMVYNCTCWFAVSPAHSFSSSFPTATLCRDKHAANSKRHAECSIQQIFKTPSMKNIKTGAESGACITYLVQEQTQLPVVRYPGRYRIQALVENGTGRGRKTCRQKNTDRRRRKIYCYSSRRREDKQSIILRYYTNFTPVLPDFSG